MAHIWLDNHREWPPRTFVGLSVKDCWEANGYAKAPSMWTASHIVAHWDNDDLAWAQDLWSKCEVACGDVIVLRVSEGDPQSIESAEHPEPWKATVNGETRMVRFLMCRNHHGLCQLGAIKAFYRMSSQQAQAILDGQLERCPDVLRSLFRRQTYPYFLLALEVLCLGLLAAHSNSQGEPEFVLSKDKDDVREALAIMQWSQFCRDRIGRELLVDDLLCEPEGCSKNRKVLREKIMATDYWMPLLEAMTNATEKPGIRIQSICKDEWDSLAPTLKENHKLTDDQKWELVEDLLSAVSTLNFSASNPIEELKYMPGLAARAFIQLANRLGGA